MARLLLAQISASDLQKAQARSFGHAKRRARITAAIDENKPPPAVKRSIGLNSRMKAGGKTGSEGGTNASGGVGTLRDDKVGNVLDVPPGAMGQPDDAEVGTGVNNRPPKCDWTKAAKHTMPSSSISSCSSNACPACRRVVLGHPLDTISYRCGGCVAVRNNRGEQHLPAEAAEVARTAGMGAFQVASVAGADELYAVKLASFGDQPKSVIEARSNGAGSGVGRRRKKNGGVGAAAVSEVIIWQQLR